MHLAKAPLNSVDVDVAVGLAVLKQWDSYNCVESFESVRVKIRPM